MRWNAGEGLRWIPRIWSWILLGGLRSVRGGGGLDAPTWGGAAPSMVCERGLSPRGSGTGAGVPGAGGLNTPAMERDRGRVAGRVSGASASSRKAYCPRLTRTEGIQGRVVARGEPEKSGGDVGDGELVVVRGRAVFHCRTCGAACEAHQQMHKLSQSGASASIGPYVCHSP